MIITNKISKFFLQIYFTNCEEIYESFGDFYFFRKLSKMIVMMLVPSNYNSKWFKYLL